MRERKVKRYRGTMCPECREESVEIVKRDGYRLLYCMNKGCGYARIIEDGRMG